MNANTLPGAVRRSCQNPARRPIAGLLEPVLKLAAAY